jgi:hypothetical protein
LLITVSCRLRQPRRGFSHGVRTLGRPGGALTDEHRQRVSRNMELLLHLQRANLPLANAKRFRYGEEDERSFVFDLCVALDYYGGKRIINPALPDLITLR